MGHVRAEQSSLFFPDLLYLLQTVFVNLVDKLMELLLFVGLA